MLLKDGGQGRHPASCVHEGRPIVRGHGATGVERCLREVQNDTLSTAEVDARHSVRWFASAVVLLCVPAASTEVLLRKNVCSWDKAFCKSPSLFQKCFQAS